MRTESWAMQVVEVMKRKMGDGYKIFPLQKKKGGPYQIGVRNEQDPVGIILYMDECKQEWFENAAGAEKAAALLMETYEQKSHYLKEVFAEGETLRNVRRNIIILLDKWNENHEALSRIPHQKFLDMVLFFAITAQAEDGVMYRTITNEDIREWGLDSSKLYEIAKKNMEELYPPILQEIRFTKKDASEKSHVLESFKVGAADTKPYMLVLSNCSQVCGSSSILVDGLLEKISEKYDTDILILPVSVHEMLLIIEPEKHEKSGFDVWLNRIYEIHQNLPEEELLPDSVYFFGKEEKQLKIVAAKA
ncbi:MAG: DUF5688 family protein [Monoglobales bacterium]